MIKSYEEIAAENKELRRQIDIQRRSLEEKNIQLAAMHYVWCSGGCVGGVHRYDGQGPEAVTEAIVEAAEHNTKRLRSWWTNRQGKLRRQQEANGTGMWTRKVCEEDSR